MARKKERLKDPPKTVEPQKRYFGTKDFSPDNVSYEVLALIYLLRWVISPFGDKAGNPPLVGQILESYGAQVSLDAPQREYKTRRLAGLHHIKIKLP